MSISYDAWLKRRLAFLTKKYPEIIEEIRERFERKYVYHTLRLEVRRNITRAVVTRHGTGVPK